MAHVLHDLSSALIEESNVDAVLGRIAQQIMQAVQADAVRYLLWNEAKEVLCHCPYGGVSSDIIEKADVVKLDEGIAGSVFQSGEPMFVSNIEEDKRVATKEVLREEGIRSIAVLPLNGPQGPVGLMNIGCQRVREWSSKDREMLGGVGPQVALIIAKARFDEQLRTDLWEQKKQARFREMLEDIRAALHRIRDAEGIRPLTQSLDRGLRGLEIPFDIFSLQLCLTRQCTMYCTAPDGSLREHVIPFPSSPVEQAVQTQRPVYRGDLGATDPYHERKEIERMYGRPLRCVVDIPFRIGTLRFASEHPWAFSKGHLALLQELAQGISAGMDRFQEFVQLHQRSEKQARQLHRAQQAAALAQQAMAAAHDLRNPLQGIWGHVDLLSERLAENDPQQKLIQGIRDGLERVQMLVDTLRRPAPFDQEDVSPIQLEDRLSGILDRIGPICSEQHVEVTRALEGPFRPVQGRPGAIERAFENLVRNAIEAMPSGGTLRVEMEQTEEQVIVRITDTGPGVSPSVRGHLFDPFYSTKDANSVGLGLWIVREVVEEHAGTVEVESQLGEGTTIIVRLPAAPDQQD